MFVSYLLHKLLSCVNENTLVALTLTLLMAERDGATVGLYKQCSWSGLHFSDTFRRGCDRSTGSWSGYVCSKGRCA